MKMAVLSPSMVREHKSAESHRGEHGLRSFVISDFSVFFFLASESESNLAQQEARAFLPV